MFTRRAKPIRINSFRISSVLPYIETWVNVREYVGYEKYAARLRHPNDQPYVPSNLWFLATRATGKAKCELGKVEVKSL
jgi:hypothetical protein